MSATLYELRHLTHNYGNGPVLQVNHRKIPSGAIIGLVGPNGSGKSTLLNLLAFTEWPTGGEIRFEDQPVSPFSRSVRQHVALLPQEPYLLMRNVESNVALGLKLRGDRSRLKERVAEALSWVGLAPERFARRNWYELSGGESRRVALAARLILKPKALLLDEPTSNVDAESARLIRRAAKTARDRWNSTVLISSHDQTWIDTSCDQVLQLFRGQVMDRGATNLISGPWQPIKEQGFYQRLLEDGQRLLVPAPADGQEENPVALLGSSELVLTNGCRPNAQACRLKGRVTRLALETPGGKVGVTMQIADLTLSLQLSHEEFNQRQWKPGGQLEVSYLPQQVNWM